MNVEFDGINKLIKVNQGVYTLDIQVDIYSDWKEWIREDDNAKFLPALRTTGGDPTVGEKSLAPYFFLMNGWKIKPASETHTLSLVGNLFVDEPETYGSNIVVPPDGYYTVLVNMSTTSDASKVISGSGVTTQDKEDIASLIDQSSVLAKEATVAKEATLAGKATQQSVDAIDEKADDIKSKIDLLPEDPASESKVIEVQGQITGVQAQVSNVEVHNIGRIKLDGDYLLIYDMQGELKAKYLLIKDEEGRVVERIPQTL